MTRICTGGQNEADFLNQLRGSYCSWIQDKVRVLYRYEPDESKLKKEINAFYNVQTFRESIMELIFGYVHNHNEAVEGALYKYYLPDRYHDCAWSSIPHKMGHNRGLNYLLLLNL